MGKNRDIVDQIKVEVENDPAGLGYKNPDGSWKSGSVTGTIYESEEEQRTPTV